jgi:hypothetical protein
LEKDFTHPAILISSIIFNEYNKIDLNAVEKYFKRSNVSAP